MGFLVNPYRFAVTDFHTKSINLDNSTEYLANSSLNTIGIANAWTLQFWHKPSTVAGGVNDFLCQIANGTDNTNKISVFLNGSGQLQSSFFSSSAVLTKNYYYGTALSTNTIYHHVLTWDGTNFLFYQDGSLVATTKLTDVAGTQTDTTRKWFVGADVGAAQLYGGLVCRNDVWNTALSAAEISSLYDSGQGFKLDIRNSFGSYASTANVVHQQAFGKEDPGTGTTDFVSSGAINLYTNAANITSADVQTFA